MVTSRRRTDTPRLTMNKILWEPWKTKTEKASAQTMEEKVRSVRGKVKPRATNHHQNEGIADQVSKDDCTFGNRKREFHGVILGP